MIPTGRNNDGPALQRVIAAGFHACRGGRPGRSWLATWRPGSARGVDLATNNRLHTKKGRRKADPSIFVPVDRSYRDPVSSPSAASTIARAA